MQLFSQCGDSLLLRHVRCLLRQALFLLPLMALSCCESAVPAGRIRIKNDSQDSSYNVVQVSASGKSYTLSPGESALLPKGSRSIYFSRRYANYTRRYEVRCPAEVGAGITIKLIDVHLGRMPGGCETVGGSKE